MRTHTYSKYFPFVVSQLHTLSNTNSAYFSSCKSFHLLHFNIALLVEFYQAVAS